MGSALQRLRRRTSDKLTEQGSHCWRSRHRRTVAYRKVAGDYSPIAVEQAMREAVDVLGVVPRRRRRFHRPIVAEAGRRYQ